jgi:16S rRNA (guanine527-N7)-methyltransferase
MPWDDLPALFPAFAGAERWLPLLRAHARLVEEAAPRVRVSSVPAEEAVRRQYAESLETWRIATERALPRRLIDVGSGGGFPGLVAAIVSPAVDVHLVEPLGKRAALLREMADALDLPNVRVHAARAEDAGRGALRDSAEVVTARAVAPLRELLEYVAPLAAPGGLLVLPKGSGAAAELAAAGDALAALNCAAGAELLPMRDDIAPNIAVVLVRKAGPTPARYPRRPGLPGKRPL